MNLITDRTELDVLLGNEKGVYSHSDLNRVEAAVAEIAAELSAMGYIIAPITKTDWELTGDFWEDSWPTETQMERYLKNIQDIWNIMPLNGKGELPTSMEKLTWRSANLIEMVLENACKQVSAIKQAWKYSGELFAGEE